MEFFIFYNVFYDQNENYMSGEKIFWSQFTNLFQMNNIVSNIFSVSRTFWRENWILNLKKNIFSHSGRLKTSRFYENLKIHFSHNILIWWECKNKKWEKKNIRRKWRMWWHKKKKIKLWRWREEEGLAQISREGTTYRPLRVNQHLHCNMEG